MDGHAAWISDPQASPRLTAVATTPATPGPAASRFTLHLHAQRWIGVKATTTVCGEHHQILNRGGGDGPMLGLAPKRRTPKVNRSDCRDSRHDSQVGWGGATLIVVPCLNEVETIGRVVSSALTELESVRGMVVVVDGGSTDGTLEHLRDHWSDAERVSVLHNPKRIQSAAVNLAVDELGLGHEYLLRVDAHGAFPPGYARALVEELERHEADSVVVKMVTTGRPGTFQASVARAQSGSTGNGGAVHRSAGRGGSWVKHGHHALFRIESFRATGGYNASFSHNEDAEFDIRFARLGFKIWLTDETQFTYFPRATARALARQYYRFGRGRAKTVVLHRTIEPRQLAVAAVAPVLVLAALSPARRVLALPAALWVSACAATDVVAAVRDRTPNHLMASGATMIMHAAWSVGFAAQLATLARNRLRLGKIDASERVS